MPNVETSCISIDLKTSGLSRFIPLSVDRIYPRPYVPTDSSRACFFFPLSFVLRSFPIFFSSLFPLSSKPNYHPTASSRDVHYRNVSVTAVKNVNLQPYSRHCPVDAKCPLAGTRRFQRRGWCYIPSCLRGESPYTDRRSAKLVSIPSILILSYPGTFTIKPRSDAPRYYWGYPDIYFSFNGSFFTLTCVSHCLIHAFVKLRSIVGVLMKIHIYVYSNGFIFLFFVTLRYFRVTPIWVNFVVAQIEKDQKK